MNKHQLCDHIIAKMEWWRHGSWAEHIDTRTKDEVITVMQNVVDGIANYRQIYSKNRGDWAAKGAHHEPTKANTEVLE